MSDERISDPKPKRLQLLVCTDRAEIAARVLLASERDGLDLTTVERDGLANASAPGAVLLLDMRLGGPFGAGTLASLRCDPRWAEAPVIALVGDRDEAAIRDAVGAGADDFIREEFLDRELATRVLGQRRAWELRDELAQRERDLVALVDLTRSFAGALDTGALLEDVTRRLARDLDLVRCSLVLTDPEGANGTVLATSDEPGIVRRRLELARYPEIREALRTRRAVVLEDAGRHPLLDPVKDAIATAGLGALAVLPLALEGELLGVLFLRSASPAISSRAIDFASTVANATAVALRNARSVDEIRVRIDQAEDKLRDLRQFEEIHEHVSEGIALVDARDGRVLSVNPAALRIVDLEAYRVRGQRLSSLLTGIDEPRCAELIRKMARGEEVRDVGMEVRRLDGHQVYLEVSGARLRDEVVLFSVRDVTERKRLQAQMSEQQEEAARQAMIVELAGAAAHELNQPLTAVMGYAELLNRKVSELDPASHQVAIIHREAERMAEIVRKLGRLMRYETAPYVGDTRIVDLDRASRDE
ncbi:PAS domain S-box protein [Vulgatibacter incomptus]|uniref:histidine kinase n=1 Tax=Vulgatibacter incomptus TaxID=1391653 RepID=A0A0K1PHP9_9BACT|nr:PAS domain S-box protein [Vulgatibacter incomptus]AKU93050.1 Circadian input kinase A [Vulgatibacter incomptus]